MQPPALELEGLSKRFGRFVALDDVNLSIRPGEIFALLGPNGAGKSTLIGSVCGLVKKTAGKIRVLGADLDEDPVAPRASVGVVPQEINFDPLFTVRETLRLQLSYYGRRRDEQRLEEVMEALALKDKADQSTIKLSGGMRRRLLIAKALVHRPKLVFLDEPTAGVDVELRRDLWTYVAKLRAEGVTIVLTTHYLEEAEALADRVGILNDGRLQLVEEKTALMERFGERTLEVRFARPVDAGALPRSAASARAELSEDLQRLRFTERNGSPSSEDLLSSLYEARLPIAEVKTRHSSLEEVLMRVLRGAAVPQ